MSERLASVLVLLLVVALGAAVSLELERVPEAVPSSPGQRPEAAALALLERWQHPTRRITSSAQLFPLPGPDTLIVLQRRNALIQPWQQQALLDWVRAGGTLVTHALPQDYDAWQAGELSNETVSGHDPLLYAAGVTAWRRGSHHRHDTGEYEYVSAEELSTLVQFYCHLDDKDPNRCDDMLCGDPAQPPHYSLLAGDADWWQLQLDPGVDLFHRDLFEQVDEDDVTVPAADSRVLERARVDDHDTLLLLTLGTGQLWVLSDLEIFTLSQIGHLDHAALLARLSANSAQVWWAASVEVPPLSQWLWRHGWPLLISALLLLLLFLWQHMPRRGVLLHNDPHRHQDFTEHLRASSALLWRLGLKGPLLGPLRQDVLRRLGRHPGGQRADARTTLAASLSGLSPAQVQQALEATPASDDELRDIVMLLQALRQRL